MFAYPQRAVCVCHESERGETGSASERVGRVRVGVYERGGATEEEVTAYLAKLANPPAAAEEEEVCSVQAQHSTQ